MDTQGLQPLRGEPRESLKSQNQIGELTPSVYGDETKRK